MPFLIHSRWILYWFGELYVILAILMASVPAEYQFSKARRWFSECVYFLHNVAVISVMDSSCLVNRYGSCFLPLFLIGWARRLLR